MALITCNLSPVKGKADFPSVITSVLVDGDPVGDDDCVNPFSGFFMGVRGATLDRQPPILFCMYPEIVRFGLLGL